MPKGPHERFFEVRGSSLIPMLNPKLASARKTVTVIHPPLANRLAAAPLAQTPKSSTSQQARPFRTEAARPSGPCIAARKGAPTHHGPESFRMRSVHLPREPAQKLGNSESRSERLSARPPPPAHAAGALPPRPGSRIRPVPAARSVSPVARLGRPRPCRASAAGTRPAALCPPGLRPGGGG